MAHPRVRGEVPAIKAGTGAEESKLWRGEPQEGIDGRRRLALATARIRCGINALKTTVSEHPKGTLASALIERTDARQTSRGHSLLTKGADRNGENALKEEPQERSGALRCR